MGRLQLTFNVCVMIDDEFKTVGSLMNISEQRVHILTYTGMVAMIAAPPANTVIKCYI